MYKRYSSPLYVGFLKVFQQCFVVFSVHIFTLLLLSLFLSILFLFLIIVKYIQCKIYHLNHFKIYNTVVLNAFTLLWNQPPEQFSSCRSLNPLNDSSFFPPPSPSPSLYYFLYMNLTAVGTVYKWIHTVLYVCDWHI